MVFCGPHLRGFSSVCAPGCVLLTTCDVGSLAVVVAAVSGCAGPPGCGKSMAVCFGGCGSSSSSIGYAASRMLRGRTPSPGGPAVALALSFFQAMEKGRIPLSGRHCPARVGRLRQPLVVPVHWEVLGPKHRNIIVRVCM